MAHSNSVSLARMDVAFLQQFPRSQLVSGHLSMSNYLQVGKELFQFHYVPETEFIELTLYFCSWLYMG
jgi:hypothetical protein